MTPRELWLAALRSGDFAQANGMLEHVEDGESSYCCLGVLCKLALESGVKVSREAIPENGEIIAWDGVTGGLPEPVMEWAGVRSNCGRYGDGNTESLVGANDFAGLNFDQIADLIERESEVLFR